ncbi:MAG: hypothetical protein LBT94_04365 [Prevotellaceae bacterium]|nr:hypothetical protein [Prevotellaceae bacterium]
MGSRISNFGICEHSEATQRRTPRASRFHMWGERGASHRDASLGRNAAHPHLSCIPEGCIPTGGKIHMNNHAFLPSVPFQRNVKSAARPVQREFSSYLDDGGGGNAAAARKSVW